MKTILSTIVALALIVLLGGGLFLYSGGYDVAATEPHWPITHRLIETARVRSIKAHAKGIATPADLGNQARIVRGSDHFSKHCASCHGGPGVEPDDMAEGMYPKPPPLERAAERYSARELFWIVKNGIKMTAMPSWADHSDDELWNTVAFIEKLPGMTHEDYEALTAAAEAAEPPGGHHKHGAAEMTMPDHDTAPALLSPDHDAH